MRSREAACTLGLLLVVAACQTPPPPENLPCAAIPAAIIETGPGPEDFASVTMADGRWRLFVSTARRGRLTGNPHGALQQVDVTTAGPALSAVDAWPGAPEHFAPLGLAYLPTDDRGNGRLFVIDRAGTPQILTLVIESGRIEGDPAAKIRGPALLRPNDLWGLEDGSVIVSNQPSLRRYLGLAPDYPALVVLDRNGRLIAADHTPAFANGIAPMPEVGRYIVADYLGRRLYVYALDEQGLAPLCHVALAGSPDNLTLDPQDPAQLYVALQESAAQAFWHILTRGWVGAASRVVSIDLEGLEIPADGSAAAVCGADDDSIELLWADGGATVAAGSTAVHLGNQLYVSQIVRPNIAVFSCSPDS